MAATYNPAALAASAKDRVRFLLGDTVNLTASAEVLDDAEITFALSFYATEAIAAIECGKALSARLGQLVDIEVGDYKETLSQRRAALVARVAQLESSLSTAGASVLSSVGGISVSENETDRENTDRARPAFTDRAFDDVQSQNADEPLSPPVWP